MAGMIAMGIGSAISAGSSLMGALSGAEGSREAAKYAKQMALRNKMMAMYQAQAIRAMGEEQAGLIRWKGRTFVGKQRALYGASGVTLEGSPIENMAQTMGEYERDARNTILNANYRAWLTEEGGESSLIQGMAESNRYEQEASNFESKALMTGIAAPFAVGSSILTGYYYGNKYGGGYGYGRYGPQGYGTEGE